ncbi:MAG: DUF1492 domain-containing protein [Roseburia sp.]|nr:DUF1492 domain-containing protein [Roseburia sp.]
MTAKEFLEQTFVLRKQIEDKKAELENYRDMAENLCGCRYGERLSAMKSTEPPFLKFSEKAMELEKEIKLDEQKLISLSGEILGIIDTLENVNERLVLRYRYLMFMSWKDIAAKMRYSRQWIFAKHSEALKNLERGLHSFTPLSY